MPRHTMIRMTACALLIAASFGCAKKEGEVGKKAEGPVIAEVDGIKITAGEFKNEVNNLPPQLQMMAQSPEGKKELVDSMIVRAIVLREAKKEGIDKSEEVKLRLEDLKDRIVAEAYLKKKLEQMTKLSDEELKKVYEEHKDKFKHAEQVRASHILVKTEKEAGDLVEQLKKGASFEDLAKKHSTDAAAAKGGDLGWFSRDAMVPAFSKAAFALKEGETSGVVKSDFGFHIIKVTGHRAAGVLPFDEVKDQLKAAVLPGKQQEKFQELKEELKKGAKISINAETLNKVDLTAPEGAAAPK